MSKENPYMNLYHNSLTHADESLSKEYLYMLAVNLGQVHNLLGVMISDVVNFMGNISLNQDIKNQLCFTQNNERSKDFSEQQIKLTNKIFMKQNKQKNQIKSNIYISQKMQIENLPIDQFNDKIKSDQIIKKELLFNEFEFNQRKQTKLIKNQPMKNSTFIDLLEVNGRKDEFETKKQVKQEDQQFSKTQSTQKVRYDQKYENQFQKEQFTNNHQKEQTDQKVNYGINIKKVEKRQDVKKKTKSPFFDLFDSSQTSSNPQQDQDVLQKLSPISQDKPFNERLYQQTQINQKPTSSNSLKPKSVGYSSQIKNDKISQPSNKYVKPYNLLEETFLVSSPKSNLLQVEEIDELESSYKKVSGKIVIKKKSQQKKESIKENQNFDEYIPRREEIGRKKVNRQTAKGSQCPDCKAFYEAISEDSKSFKSMCECTSRHKSSTTFMKKHQVENYSQEFSLD